MKILNLDSLAKVERAVTIDGVEHPVHEVSVQDFVDNLAAAEALEAVEATRTGAQKTRDGVELSIKTIVQSIPSLSKERVMKLGVSGMLIVLQFIRGEFDPELLKGAADQAAENAAAAVEGGSEGAEKKLT